MQFIQEHESIDNNLCKWNHILTFDVAVSLLTHHRKLNWTCSLKLHLFEYIYDSVGLINIQYCMSIVL